MESPSTQSKGMTQASCVASASPLAAELAAFGDAEPPDVRPVRGVLPPAEPGHRRQEGLHPDHALLHRE